jgi:MFS family permease
MMNTHNTELKRRTVAPAALAASAVPLVEDDDNIGKQQRQPRQQRDDRRRQLSVFAILASSFLNLLGFTMAGPITPALGKHFGLQVGASFGSLTSAYPLGMLFGLFLWPSLSDKMGRKPIMTASLLGSAVGLTLQSWVIRKELPLLYFLGARALTGAFAGSSPVSKAYLADIGDKDGKLPRYLALRDAASTMAFIVGPMLGGILYDVIRFLLPTTSEIVSASGSLAFVIGASAAASLGAALLVGSMVQDVKPKKRKKKMKTTDEDASSNSSGSGSSISSSSDNDEVEEEAAEGELVSCPLGRRMWTGVASVCVVSFMFNIGDSAFHAFFSALLRDGAGMATHDIGLLYTLLACISFAVSTTGSTWIMKSFGPVATCAAGLGCIGTGLLCLGVAASNHIAFVKPSFSVLAAAASIYYCGVPLYGPTIPTMLLRCVPSHRRGAILGLDGTINTIARIISPLVMGDVYRRYGAGAAFGLAGTIVLGGAVTTLVRRFVVLRDIEAIQK